MKKIGGFLLRLIVSAGTIGLVVWTQRHHIDEAMGILHQGFRWEYFGFAVLTYIAGLATITLRLQYVFRVQGIHLTYRETFYLSWVGLFFNLFLPSAIGGDVIKVYYAYKHSGKKVQAATSVFWDRLLGFATLVTMAIVGIIAFNKELNDPRIDYLVIGFLIFFALIGLFFMSKRFAKLFQFLKHLVPSEKIRAFFNEAYHSIHTFRHHPKLFAVTLGLSLVGQALFIIVHNWLIGGLGVSMNSWLLFILVPIVTIVSMAPSLGGLGVREAGMVLLFKQYMPGERALALSLLLDMLIYGMSFVGGIIYAVKGGLKSKMMKEMEEIK